MAVRVRKAMMRLVAQLMLMKSAMALLLSLVGTISDMIAQHTAAGKAVFQGVEG